MPDHYFITADHGHIRIFQVSQATGQHEPSLSQVEAMDFPAGRQSYVDRDTSMAGRFRSSKHQAAGPAGAIPGRAGMSIDERLPMQREEERRRTRDVADEIEAFLTARPDATWDFAGAAAFHRSVVGQLTPQLRQRLRHTIEKDLVNQPNDELRARYLAVGAF